MRRRHVVGVRASCQRRRGLGGCQAERASLVPYPVVGRVVQHSPSLAAEQPTVWCEPVAGNVLPQDGHQLRRDGDDANGTAGPVLEAALFMSGSAVGPLLADARRGLVEFEAAPPGFGQVAVTARSATASDGHSIAK